MSDARPRLIGVTITPAHEPPKQLSDPHELLSAYLDHYRETVLRKVDGMSEHELRTSRLPSGWTPLGLLVHLLFMEQRWFVWGFRAEPVAQPWGDRGPGDSWQVPEGWDAERVEAELRAQWERSRAAVAGAALADRAAVGGRFPTADKAPTLAWTLFHVLQEYARHAGHLDIARELSDGATGE
ncbi:MAG: DUF664 domain-containing protein [Hamadaea sp.]|nr:DUF664 domain-containing protein [Hamadaea sp.]